jgi:tetratricopeptide (TPR) repeat protein
MTTPDHLAHLEGAGLVRQVALDPDPSLRSGQALEYLFRHALVQDAAYASLLRADRRRLHRVVAETLEAEHADNPDQAALLAEHWAVADDAARALHYYRRAAEHATARYANAEAARHYDRAVHYARQTGAAPPDLIALYARCGRAHELGGDYAGAIAVYEELRALGRAQADPALELAGLVELAVARATVSRSHDATVAGQLGTDALALARHLGDVVAETRVLWSLLLLYGGPAGTDMPQAAFYGEQAETLARAHGLTDQLAVILNDLSYVHLVRGHRDRALAVVQEANTLFRAAGNLPLLTDNLTRAGCASYMSGNLAAASAALTESAELARATRNRWAAAFSGIWLAAVRLEQAAWPELEADLRETIGHADAVGFVPGLLNAQAFLVNALVVRGDTAGALALLDSALEISARHIPNWLPFLRQLQAFAIGRAGDWPAAWRVLTTNPVPGESADLLTHNLRGLAQYEVRRAVGDWSGLLAEMDALLAQMRSLGHRPAVAHIHYYRAAALAGLGRAAEAAESEASARRKAVDMDLRWLQLQLDGTAP